MPAVQNYDVVVIGAGGAGFAAAVEAKSKGANVVLIEKNADRRRKLSDFRR